LNCPYRYKVEGDPWRYCGYYKKEKVICGCEGYEDDCIILKKEIEKND